MMTVRPRLRDGGMHRLHDDDDLRIDHLPGREPRLVVAVGGIGHGFGGLQRAEFVGTASQGGRNHVLFVADRRRSWFTSPGLVERIAELAGGVMREIGAASCHTLGNSMGGYGAFRLSREMPVATASAFSPQASMDPALIDERRWEEHRPAIRLDRHPPLSECLVEGTRYAAVFGANSRREMAHRALLPAWPGLRVIELPDGGHNIVQILKEAEILMPLVAAMTEADDDAIDRLMAEFLARRRAASEATAAGAAGG